MALDLGQAEAPEDGGAGWESGEPASEAPRRMPPVRVQSTSPGKAMLNALF